MLRVVRPVAAGLQETCRRPAHPVVPSPDRPEPDPVVEQVRRVSNSRGKQFEYDPGTGAVAVIESDGWRAVVPLSSSTGIAARLLYWNAEIEAGRGDDATGQAARALLDGLSATELREIADELGAVTRAARTKPQLVDTIVNAAVSSARQHRDLRKG